MGLLEEVSGSLDQDSRAVRNQVEEQRLGTPAYWVTTTRRLVAPEDVEDGHSPVSEHHEDRLPPGLQAVSGGLQVSRHRVVLQERDHQRPLGGPSLEEPGGEGSVVCLDHLLANVVPLEGEGHQFGDREVGPEEQDRESPEQEGQELNILFFIIVVIT